jgi:hypothetical protein
MKTLFLVAIPLAALCGCQRTPATTPPRSTGADDATITPAAQPVYVDLPLGWQPRTPSVSTVRQMADCPEIKAHFTLAIQPQAEFNNDLMAWAEMTKKATAKQTKLANRTETELKATHIGDHSVVEYEIRGDAGSYRGFSRVIMLPIGEWFCKVTCWTGPEYWNAAQRAANWLSGCVRWTGPEYWNAAQPRFDEVILRLRIASPKPNQ